MILVPKMENRKMQVQEAETLVPTGTLLVYIVGGMYFYNANEECNC